MKVSEFCGGHSFTEAKEQFFQCDRTDFNFFLPGENGKKIQRLFFIINITRLYDSEFNYDKFCTNVRNICCFVKKKILDDPTLVQQCAYEHSSRLAHVSFFKQNKRSSDYYFDS